MAGNTGSGNVGGGYVNHTVVVLDDDLSILSDLESLVTAHGYRVRLHLGMEDFFQAGLPASPACLILGDESGSGTTPQQVYDEVQRRGWFIPTVFLTAHWNLQTVVHAMRSGADGFLTKPCDPAEILSAVAHALQRSYTHQQNGLLAAEARDRATALSTRECEIVRQVAAGAANKQIATLLDISLDTVKTDRGRAMRKMGAGNAAELIHLAILAGIVVRKDPDGS